MAEETILPIEEGAGHVLSDKIVGNGNGASPLVTREIFYQGRVCVIREGRQTASTKTVEGLTGIETKERRQVIKAIWIQNAKGQLVRREGFPTRSR